jgi:hypothetical protein
MPRWHSLRRTTTRTEHRSHDRAQNRVGVKHQNTVEDGPRALQPLHDRDPSRMLRRANVTARILADDPF